MDMDGIAARLGYALIGGVIGWPIGIALGHLLVILRERN
jgi:hypothetical protein